MSQLADVMKLSQRIQDDAVAFYLAARVPVAFRRASPMVLARAALECAGDWTRCVIDEDNSITVYNQRQWHPSS